VIRFYFGLFERTRDQGDYVRISKSFREGKKGS
jgi:hypothetical protein